MAQRYVQLGLTEINPFSGLKNKCSLQRENTSSFTKTNTFCGLFLKLIAGPSKTNIAGTVHCYWGNMAWVCISKTSQPPSVGSSPPSSLTWVKAVCLIKPLEILACFPLLPFLWEQAALRWTWADLKEGKPAKFMKIITLARKKDLQR